MRHYESAEYLVCRLLRNRLFYFHRRQSFYVKVCPLNPSCVHGVRQRYNKTSPMKFVSCRG